MVAAWASQQYGGAPFHHSRQLTMLLQMQDVARWPPARMGCTLMKPAWPYQARLGRSQARIAVSPEQGISYSGTKSSGGPLKSVPHEHSLTCSTVQPLDRANAGALCIHPFTHYTKYPGLPVRVPVLVQCCSSQHPRLFSNRGGFSRK